MLFSDLWKGEVKKKEFHFHFILFRSRLCLDIRGVLFFAWENTHIWWWWWAYRLIEWAVVSIRSGGKGVGREAKERSSEKEMGRNLKAIAENRMKAKIEKKFFHKTAVYLYRYDCLARKGSDENCIYRYFYLRMNSWWKRDLIFLHKHWISQSNKFFISTILTLKFRHLNFSVRLLEIVTRQRVLSCILCGVNLWTFKFMYQKRFL